MSRALSIEKAGLIRKRKASRGLRPQLASASSGASHQNPWIVLAASLFLLILTAWLWSPALQYGFIYDDHLQIEANPWIQSWDHIGPLLRQPLWTQLGPEHASPYYRPLFSTLLLLEYSLFGQNPALWHLVSIGLHGIVSLALFSFLLLLCRQWLPALAGAALFLASPLNAEVVNWVSACDESLCVLLILLALCSLALSARAATPTHALLFRLASSGLLVLAVLAKETAIVAVLLAWACDRLLLDPQPRSQSPLRHLPLLLPLVVFLLAHRSAHAPDARSLIPTLTAMPGVALLAFRKLLWPGPIGQFYDLWIDQPHSALFLTLQIAALVLIAALCIWAGLRYRFISWALLVITLPIAASTAAIWLLRDYDLFHDRYLYLPIAGVAILVAAAVAKIPPRRQALLPVIAILALAISAEAWQSRLVSAQFAADTSFFSNAIQVAPHNILALQLLAESELRMGDCHTAIAHDQQAEQLRPDLWKTTFFLGIANSRCGLNAAAADAFTRATAAPGATTDQSALAWYELARARIAEGDLSGAEAALAQAALRDPGSSKIRNLLAHISSSPTPAR